MKIEDVPVENVARRNREWNSQKEENLSYTPIFL